MHTDTIMAPFLSGQPGIACYDLDAAFYGDHHHHYHHHHQLHGPIVVDEYQVPIPLHHRRLGSGNNYNSIPSKHYQYDSMASSPSPASVTTGPSQTREGSRIGRPPQWTVSRSRKLARLYLYTTLSIEKIIKVLEDDVFKPRKNSAQKTIHKMLDNDPRYLRPESRIEMNQRINNLTASITRRRNKAPVIQTLATHVATYAEVEHSDIVLPTTEASSTSGSSRRTDDVSAYDFSGSPGSMVSAPRFAMPFRGLPHGHPGTESSSSNPDSDAYSGLVQDLKRRVSDCSTQFAHQITALIKDFTISDPSVDGQSVSGRRPSAAVSDSSDHDLYMGESDDIPREPFEAFPEPAFAVPGDFLSAHRRNCADFPGQQHGRGDCWCSIAHETSNDLASWLTPTGELSLRARHVLGHPSPANMRLCDSFGNTPLHLVSALEGYQDTLFALVLNCSDLNALGVINTAGQTFLHVLNLEWFNDLSNHLAPLKQLLAHIHNTVPELVLATDAYGRTFFHRAHSLVKDPEALTSLFAPFDPILTSKRDAFGFNPLASIHFGEGPYSPPRRGGSHSPPAEDLGSRPQSSRRSSQTADEKSLLAYHARLVQVIQSSYNSPHLEDSEGRNGLHCLAEAIIDQQTMDKRVQRSGVGASRPQLKRKLTTDTQSDSVTSFPAASPEGTLMSKRRHLTGLLHSGLDINHYDKHGLTPLMAFITHISDDQDDKSKTLLTILETLIRSGARIEARNRRGETPLLIAARLGRKMALTTLLEHGANVNARNVDGRGVLQIIDETCKGPAAKHDVSLYARMEACRVLLTGRRDWGVAVTGTAGVGREWRL
ncbi:hypothetical protein QBC35DRAFT_554889, partial [Podospora australis]